MTPDEERDLIRLTIHPSGQHLMCPLCFHLVAAPPVPIVDSVGAAFGMSGETLARVHAESVAKRAVRDLDSHLRGHSPLEWLKAERAGLLANRGAV